MKFFAAFVLLATGAYASSTITAAPSIQTAVSLTPQQSSMKSCLGHCSGDSNCLASCAVVPAPNSAQAQGNIDCVSKSCIPLQTVTANNYSAYGSCVKACQTQFFFNPQNSGGVPNGAGGSTPQATGSSGSSSGSGSGSGSGSNGSSGSGSNGGSGSNASGSSTGTAASASGTGKPSSGNKFTYSAAGLLGAVGLIVLAL